MNKMVNGSQLTIVWHVDDCKISHKDETVVTDILEKLEDKFGKEKSIAITRGPRKSQILYVRLHRADSWGG